MLASNTKYVAILSGTSTLHQKRLNQFYLCVLVPVSVFVCVYLSSQVVPGVVENLKVITRDASMRIARYAFNYAVQNSRKMVTCVHKANIMKMSDGLFVECARTVAKEYPQIKYTETPIDNVCLQLVTDPKYVRVPFEYCFAYYSIFNLCLDIF